jgi:preprotein translocase subunit Sss1
MLRKNGKHGRRRLPASARKRRVPLVLAGILLIAAIGVAIRLITATTSPPISARCPRVAVPAYFAPGAYWSRADNSKPRPGIMILDITGSGAGSSPDRRYQEVVKRAQAAGIMIMGYSTTDYTQRAAATVETDVKNYKAWYNVTDIFLDQVSSGTSQIGYYRHLTDYIHGVNPGSTVMLNPGTYPDQQYMSVGDVVMVYENTYANFVNLQVPRWARNYPADKFAYTIYATSGSHLANAIHLSRKRGAGYVYVTNGHGSDPYDSLPSYWSSEDAVISAQCADPSAASSQAQGAGGISTGRDYAVRRGQT